MTAERERPPGGGLWLNNGEVHERQRVSCLEHAERAESEGDEAGAAHWHALAKDARLYRDRSHAEGLRRQMNSRIKHGRY